MPKKPAGVDSKALAAQITRAVGPPTAITLYFCPACGSQVRGTYDIDERRAKCSKRIHKATPKRYRYVREGST